MVHDYSHTPKEGIKGRFKDEKVSNTLSCIQCLQYTNLRYLLSNEYTITPIAGMISVSELKRRFARDLFEHVEGNDLHSNNKLFDVATYLYEKKHGESKGEDSIERNKEITAEYLKMISKLNFNLSHIEEILVGLITDYLNKVERIGVEELEHIEESNIPPEIQALSNKLVLKRIFKRTYFNALNVDEKCGGMNYTAEQQELWIEHILTRISCDRTFKTDLDRIICEVELENPSLLGNGNTSLGLDELGGLFAKHESIRYLQPISADDKDIIVEYRDVHEIGDFMENYFFDVENCIIDKNHKSSRGLVHRLESLVENSDLQPLLKTMLLHSWEDGQKTISKIDGILRLNKTLERVDFREAWKNGKVKAMLFSQELYDSILDPKDFSGQIVRSELITYLKIKLTSEMAERNLRDWMSFLACAETGEDIDRYLRYMEEEHVTTYWANSSVMLPIKTYQTDNIYETFAKSLGRNIEQRKYKAIYLIWASLVDNFFSVNQEQNNGDPNLYLMKRTGAYTAKVKKRVSEMSNLELSKLLEGRNITNLKERRAAVQNIGKWFSLTGLLYVDIDDYIDFKSIYDVIYQFTLSPRLKEERIEIAINSMKKENTNPEEYTVFQRAYLTLGIYISTLFNRGVWVGDDFVQCCSWLKLIIDDIYQYYDLENYDYIMILLNAFRQFGKACVLEDVQKHKD